VEKKITKIPKVKALIVTRCYAFNLNTTDISSADENVNMNIVGTAAKIHLAAE